MLGSSTARPESDERRELIGRHPDLAAAVVKLYKLESFAQWCGYLPLARDHHGRANDSHYRRRLVELLDEAQRRDHEAAA